MSEEFEMILPVGFALELAMPSKKTKCFDDVDPSTIKFDIPDRYKKETDK
jgi:hypothetical protein